MRVRHHLNQIPEAADANSRTIYLLSLFGGKHAHGTNSLGNKAFTHRQVNTCRNPERETIIFRSQLIALQPSQSLLHLFKALEVWQLGSDLIRIRRQPSSVVDLLESLTWHAPAHICTLRCWEKTLVAQLIDARLPLLTCIVCRIDILQALSFNLLNSIHDPATLYFDARRTIGKKCRTMRT